jgi:hypothetical protein
MQQYVSVLVSSVCLLSACSVFEAPFSQGQDGAIEDDAQTTDATIVDAGVDARVVPIPPRPTLTSCGFGAPTTSGTISSPALDEVSGIAASRANARVVWMIEDSGSAAIVHAVNDLGMTVATYMVGGTAVDFEDIAVGPGPGGGDYLYIADIGDNNGSRPTRTIYRAPEPVVVWNQALVNGSLMMTEPLPFTFPAGDEDNAEALFVDPATQDIYVVSKNGFTRPNTVFRLPAPHTAAVSRVLTYVGPIFAGVGNDVAITAADISADGLHIIVRSLHSANHWTRTPGTSIADTMLLGTPCAAPVGAIEAKGESISFNATGYFTTSEGAAQPLTFVPFAP